MDRVNGGWNGSLSCASSKDLVDIPIKMSKHASRKPVYYAVPVGRLRGVFLSFVEAQKSFFGIPAGHAKKFNDLHEAHRYAGVDSRLYEEYPAEFGTEKLFSQDFKEQLSEQTIRFAGVGPSRHSMDELSIIDSALKRKRAKMSHDFDERKRAKISHDYDVDVKPAIRTNVIMNYDVLGDKDDVLPSPTRSHCSSTPLSPISPSPSTLHPAFHSSSSAISFSSSSSASLSASFFNNSPLHSATPLSYPGIPNNLSLNSASPSSPTDSPYPLTRIDTNNKAFIPHSNSTHSNKSSSSQVGSGAAPDGMTQSSSGTASFWVILPNQRHLRIMDFPVQEWNSFEQLTSLIQDKQGYVPQLYDIVMGTRHLLPQGSLANQGVVEDCHLRIKIKIKGGSGQEDAKGVTTRSMRRSSASTEDGSFTVSWAPASDLPKGRGQRGGDKQPRKKQDTSVRKPGSGRPRKNLLSSESASSSSSRTSAASASSSASSSYRREITVVVSQDSSSESTPFRTVIDGDYVGAQDLLQAISLLPQDNFGGDPGGPPFSLDSPQSGFHWAPPANSQSCIAAETGNGLSTEELNLQEVSISCSASEGDAGVLQNSYPAERANTGAGFALSNVVEAASDASEHAEGSANSSGVREQVIFSDSINLSCYKILSKMVKDADSVRNQSPVHSWKVFKILAWTKAVKEWAKMASETLVDGWLSAEAIVQFFALPASVVELTSEYDGRKGAGNEGGADRSEGTKILKRAEHVSRLWRFGLVKKVKRQIFNAPPLPRNESTYAMLMKKNSSKKQALVGASLLPAIEGIRQQRECEGNSELLHESKCFSNNALMALVYKELKENLDSAPDACAWSNNLLKPLIHLPAYSVNHSSFFELYCILLRQIANTDPDKLATGADAFVRELFQLGLGMGLEKKGSGAAVGDGRPIYIGLLAAKHALKAAMQHPEVKASHAEMRDIQLCYETRGLEICAHFFSFAYKNGFSIHKDDATNAFNELSRKQARPFSTVRTPVLRHLTTWLYGENSSAVSFAMVDGVPKPIIHEEGVRQGCVLGTHEFTSALHESVYRPIKEEFKIKAFALTDDFFKADRPADEQQWSATFANLGNARDKARRLLAAMGITCSNEKQMLLIPDRAPDPDHSLFPSGTFTRQGMVMGGIPIGSDGFIREFFAEKLEKNKASFNSLLDQKVPRAYAIQIFVSTCASQLIHLTAGINPSIIEGQLQEYDNWVSDFIINRLLVLDQSVAPPAPSTSMMNFFKAQIRCKVAKGGLGLLEFRVFAALNYFCSLVSSCALRDEVRAQVLERADSKEALVPFAPLETLYENIDLESPPMWNDLPLLPPKGSNLKQVVAHVCETLVPAGFFRQKASLRKLINISIMAKNAILLSDAMQLGNHPSTIVDERENLTWKRLKLGDPNHVVVMDNASIMLFAQTK